MAFFKITDKLFAGYTNICKYPDRNAVTGNIKTVGICRIMKFGKACNA